MLSLLSNVAGGAVRVGKAGCYLRVVPTPAAFLFDNSRIGAAPMRIVPCFNAIRMMSGDSVSAPPIARRSSNCKNMMAGAAFVAVLAGSYYVVKKRNEEWEAYQKDRDSFVTMYQEGRDKALAAYHAARDSTLAAYQVGRGRLLEEGQESMSDANRSERIALLNAQKEERNDMWQAQQKELTILREKHTKETHRMLEVTFPYTLTSDRDRVVNAHNNERDRLLNAHDKESQLVYNSQVRGMDILFATHDRERAK